MAVSNLAGGRNTAGEKDLCPGSLFPAFFERWSVASEVRAQSVRSNKGKGTEGWLKLCSCTVDRCIAVNC